MFTSGRISFIIFFVVVFVIGLIWAYRKEIKQRAYVFKGGRKILIILLLFLFTFLTIIRLLGKI